MKDHRLRNVKDVGAGPPARRAGPNDSRHRTNAACPRATEIEEPAMIVTIVTFHLPQPATLADITKTFQGTAPKYQGIPGLLRKNYFMSEDGRRAGGIYVWESRADADRVYTAEWRAFVTGKYGTPPAIEYLHSPVMVDNSAGTISVAA
jgi:putative monooxygenase ydhR